MPRYYIKSPSGIARYLYKTITGFGFFAWYNYSEVSESVYLGISTGTTESQNAYNVRVSNHSDPRGNSSIYYDCDICGTHSRQGATTYIKFLVKFAAEHNKTLSTTIQSLQPGTKMYKKYAISLQKRA